MLFRPPPVTQWSSRCGASKPYKYSIYPTFRLRWPARMKRLTIWPSGRVNSVSQRARPTDYTKPNGHSTQRPTRSNNYQRLLLSIRGTPNLLSIRGSTNFAEIKCLHDPTFFSCHLVRGSSRRGYIRHVRFGRQIRYLARFLAKWNEPGRESALLP